MPEEMRFLLRVGLYGVGISIVYYVVSREPGGTLLMLGLGVAAIGVLLVIWLERRRAGLRVEGPIWRWALLPAPDVNGGLTDERARLPGASLAPITVAFGLMLAALSLVFGVWLLPTAIIPLVIGLRSWMGDAMAEHSAMEQDDQPAVPVVNRR